MATIDVELPALGESVVEGTVSRWLVKEGEEVEQDQPLVEVTTDKVDAEVPSPAAGVVSKILVSEGETVDVGAVLAKIDKGASAEDDGGGKDEAAEKKSAGKKAAKKKSDGKGRDEADDEDADDEADEADEGERKRPAAREARSESAAERRQRHPSRSAAEDGERATPVARRMAEERDVDLSEVRGSGPSGRITKRDVAEATPGAVRGRAKETPAPGRGAPPASGEPSEMPAYMRYQLEEGDKVVPLSPLRRIVAEHMVLSKRVSPHVGTVAEIDMGAVVRFRDAHKRGFEETHGYGLTFLPFIVHATVRALREYPRLNASMTEDAIVEKQGIHIGVAVETDKGLVVPVVRHADRLSLAGLAASIEDISTRARNKKLSPDELKGGTFTVSNPGRHGNLYGFAIINQPQVGILRMGEIVKRPVVRSVDGADAIVIRPIMHLALSYDHRVVDGAPANAFLHRVRELLEEGEFAL